MFDLEYDSGCQFSINASLLNQLKVASIGYFQHSVQIHDSKHNHSLEKLKLLVVPEMEPLELNTF